MNKIEDVKKILLRAALIDDFAQYITPQNIENIAQQICQLFEPKPESRSVQRRKAAQQGKPAPDFSKPDEGRKLIECAYEDWDDTVLPHPICHCLKREGIDCANVPNDVAQCPDFVPKPDEDR